MTLAIFHRFLGLPTATSEPAATEPSEPRSFMVRGVLEVEIPVSACTQEDALTEARRVLERAQAAVDAVDGVWSCGGELEA